MKKCLLVFHSGIGDLINLTPALRELSHHGYHADILVRQHVYDSGVFEECPYATLIPLDIGSIASGGPRAVEAQKIVTAEVEARKDAYDAHWVFRGDAKQVRGALMALYYKQVVTAMDITPTVKISPAARYGPPEVWIPEWCEQEATHFVESNYPEGFIFKRTGGPGKGKSASGSHPGHHWRDAGEWIERELPALPVFDQDARLKWDSINILFAIAKRASHIVIYSSVMVHACEAMGVTMDIVNYGHETSKHWPEDPNTIKIIRCLNRKDKPVGRPKDESGAKYSSDGGKTWWAGENGQDGEE